IFIFILFSIFSIVPIFSQEGRFLIMGDDIKIQLKWIDLQTGDQYFSLKGITTTVRYGTSITNDNNYTVTVIYEDPKSGRIGTVTLQPKGVEGSSIYLEGIFVTLLSQMPR
ncbi:MAG: hypothetical protein LBQ82_04240, partial [Treponema sp.]|nr:hypothetical protein [Treponema sp.]